MEADSEEFKENMHIINIFNIPFLGPDFFSL